MSVFRRRDQQKNAHYITFRYEYEDMNASVMKRAAPVPPSVPPSAGAAGRLASSAEVDGMTDSASIGTSGTGHNSRKSSVDDTVTLNIILPNGDTRPFKVNRRMPLMDLLVHAASVHHFNPSEYTVHNPQDRLHSSSLANTPVGQLKTEVVQIVPKDSNVLHTFSRTPKSIKDSVRTATAEQPFEKTFRLQINLPQQQKMLLRVSPKQTLHEILGQVCTERNLDERRFTLRNPLHPEHPLDMNRLAGDENTKEITLVPSAQAVVPQDNRKFGKFTEPMEPPKSPVSEQPRFGLSIFQLCRKKRTMSKGFASPSSQPSMKDSPLRPSKISKSMANLTDMSPLEVSSAPTKPSRNSKKPAPRPPSADTSTLPHTETTYTAIEHAHRTRHHSESSGYDESLVNSNSPERDGDDSRTRLTGSGNGFGNGNGSGNGFGNGSTDGNGGTGAHVRVPVSARSSTSTPDSGLKSASEGVLKSVHVSKKKAPAPPPPSAVPVVAPLPQSVVTPDEVKVEVRSRAASSVSGTSTSDRISIGSFAESHSNRSIGSSVSVKAASPKETSSDTMHALAPAVTQHSLDQLEQEANTIITASFVFENGSQHSNGSVAGQDFDSESSIDSLDMHPHDTSSVKLSTTSSIDVEVHPQPLADNTSDWGYSAGVPHGITEGIPQESTTLRRSFPPATVEDGGFWLPTNTTVVQIGQDVEGKSETSPVRQVQPDRHLNRQGQADRDIGREVQVGGQSRKQDVPTAPAVSSFTSTEKQTRDPTTVTPAEVQEEVFVQEKVKTQKPPGTPLAFKGLFSPSAVTASTPQSVLPVERVTVQSRYSDRAEARLIDQLQDKDAALPSSDRVKKPLMETLPAVSSAGEKTPDLVPSPPSEVKVRTGSVISASDSGVHSQRTFVEPVKSPERPEEKPSKPKKPEALKIVIPPACEKSPSLPSPAPSNSSVSSLKAPPLPLSTPPPVTTKPFMHPVSSVRRSPAHVSISSLADERPDRYRDMVIHQPNAFTPTPTTNDVPVPTTNDIPTPTLTTNEALQKEIRIVQDIIISLQQETHVVQSHSTFTPEELLAISEKQRVLQEHIQRQIALTQQLIHYEQTTSAQDSTTPQSSAPAPQKARVTSSVDVRAYSAPVNKVPVVSKVTTVRKPTPMTEEISTAADVLRRTQPKVQHRDSWLTEASRRFDFSKSSSSNDHSPGVATSPSVGTSPRVATSQGVPDRSRGGTPSPVLGQRDGTDVSKAADTSRRALITSVRGEATRTFSSPTRMTEEHPIPRNITAARNLSGSVKTGYGTGVTSARLKGDSPTETKDTEKVVLRSGGTFRPTVPVKTTDSLQQDKPNIPLKVRPMSQYIPRTVDTQDNASTEREGDFMESIVRSSKNGMPSPYHHVNGGKGDHRMVSQSVADATPAPPPPPPPPTVTPEAVQSARKVLSPVKREVKATLVKEPSGADQRAQLCDAIKTFSVGSLRKVPTAAQKTWAPKIR